jgi:hypothetical protein
MFLRFGTYYISDDCTYVELVDVGQEKAGHSVLVRLTQAVLRFLPRETGHFVVSTEGSCC